MARRSPCAACKLIGAVLSGQGRQRLGRAVRGSSPTTARAAVPGPQAAAEYGIVIGASRVVRVSRHENCDLRFRIGLGLGPECTRG